MKIQAAIIITIAIVIMIIVSVTAFGTFSFAVRTNSTTHTESTIKRVPSQITTKTTNPVAHNATLKSGIDPCSGKTAGFLWSHVYGVDNGNPQWGRPRFTGDTKSRLNTIKDCITVTGKVYSQTGKGTEDDEDGDLHFTLTLDKKDEGYSNNNPHPAAIIVEVICHKDHGATPTTPKDYKKQWGDYCNGVDPEYPYDSFPARDDHLSVSGRLVYDPGTKQKWNEIHPAFAIHKA